LADGTNIVRPALPPEFTCRDSQGRTRAERTGPTGRPAPAIKIVEINDPAAGIRYVIDSYNRVTHESHFPPVAAMRAMPTNILRPSRPTGTTAAVPPPTAVKSNSGLSSTTSEDLGTKVIDDVRVEGRKLTTTIAVGVRGNDRPIVITHEMWSSPELRLVISSQSVDPEIGDFSIRIVNLNRSEPDPALFLPPPDYKVVEETGPFVVRIQQ
jgi:hypothetical protein